MTTALYTHPDCLLHENGPGNLDAPERLRAVLAELDKPAYAALERKDAPLATVDQIARVHPRAYVEHVLSSVPQKGFFVLDENDEGQTGEETGLSPTSGKAALRAAGALIAAVDDVVTGKYDKAFCAVRPPGHHARKDIAHGFCIFNNIAIGAAHALEAHGLKRIAIVDFDVHHGDGTQTWAESHPEVLFCSSHQMPLYPGTGEAGDRGPLGNILNVPLPPHADGRAFREALSAKTLPAVARFAPELIMISAGFDKHRDDPISDLTLVEDDYAWITRELCALARKHSKGRIVSALEGGYNIAALASCTGVHVSELLTNYS